MMAGRRRGGYLGGSTVIIPRKRKAAPDDGPPKALEQARILNALENASTARQEHAVAAAEAVLTEAEDAAINIAFAFSYLRKHPSVEADFERLTTFVEDSADNLSTLGPGFRRRSTALRNDLEKFRKARVAKPEEQFSIIYGTTTYATFIAPKLEAGEMRWRVRRAQGLHRKL
ncbi:MAG: hypothetical protein DWQ53_09830 [Microcystis flos-aquae DF17]|nr:MAG: hypothetical protein DWQ53_09830 [Microcystis flos-aquae DF17]